MTLDLDGKKLSLRTDRGVFAADEIDKGTRILIKHGPKPPARGNILDLGCGYGPIAISQALRAPDSSVWAVDINERALELAAFNAEGCGAQNVTVCSPDEVPQEIRFNAIYSNPPIRVGKGALHALLMLWLGRLEPSGHAWLVVQKFLGSDSLAKWLDEQGYPTKRLFSRETYRVLEVAAGAEP